MDGDERPAHSERLAEVDVKMRPLNLAIALAVAGAAPIFLPQFGPEFLVFMLLPIVWWTLRALGLARRIGLEAWSIGLFVIVAIAIVGGAVTSGGTYSAGIFFGGVAALLAQATFPRWEWTAGLGLVIVITVVVIDLALDRSLNAFNITAAAVLGSYLPYVVRRLVDVEQIHRRRAVIDSLTGCLNRRSLEMRIDELEAQAARTGSPIAVISFDIDHFKTVNDEFGHAAGDRVLAGVAYAVRKQLRRFELFYRLGGEEFAVVLPGTDLELATNIALRLRTVVSAENVGDIGVTASFGVVSAEAPVTIESLLEDADTLLYRAKAAGRDCVAVFGRSDVLRNDVPVNPVGASPAATAEQA